jgi:hypothetical protein
MLVANEARAIAKKAKAERAAAAARSAARARAKITAPTGVTALRKGVSQTELAGIGVIDILPRTFAPLGKLRSAQPPPRRAASDMKITPGPRDVRLYRPLFTWYVPESGKTAQWQCYVLAHPLEAVLLCEWILQENGIGMSPHVALTLLETFSADSQTLLPLADEDAPPPCSKLPWLKLASTAALHERQLVQYDAIQARRVLSWQAGVWQNGGGDGGDGGGDGDGGADGGEGGGGDILGLTAVMGAIGRNGFDYMGGKHPTFKHLAGSAAIVRDLPALKVKGGLRRWAAESLSPVPDTPELRHRFLTGFEGDTRSVWRGYPMAFPGVKPFVASVHSHETATDKWSELAEARGDNSRPLLISVGAAYGDAEIDLVTGDRKGRLYATEPAKRQPTLVDVVALDKTAAVVRYAATRAALANVNRIGGSSAEPGVWAALGLAEHLLQAAIDGRRMAGPVEVCVYMPGSAAEDHHQLQAPYQELYVQGLIGGAFSVVQITTRGKVAPIAQNRSFSTTRCIFQKIGYFLPGG